MEVRDAPLALVQFATHGFDSVMQGRRPAFFNPYGATVEIVRALNELGFRVDLVDASDAAFEPARPYALFVGHGPQYARLARLLDAPCRKVRYATGSHVKSFLRNSKERYRRFRASRGLPEESAGILRDVDPATDYSRVDLLIALGERTAASYRQEGLRASHVHNAAYIGVGDSPNPEPKNWERARHNFIYVAGTHGNVQKGLDLLLEAFACHRQMHLYIYSKLDGEILASYGAELRLPNIHYVYHHSKLPFLRSQARRRCAFSLCAGITSGQSTAFLASMHEGFIPVFNVETDIPMDGCGVVIERNEPEAVGEALEKACRMPGAELPRQSEAIRGLFARRHRPECFRSDFREHVRRLIS